MKSHQSMLYKVLLTAGVAQRKFRLQKLTTKNSRRRWKTKQKLNNKKGRGTNLQKNRQQCLV